MTPIRSDGLKNNQTIDLKNMAPVGGLHVNDHIMLRCHAFLNHSYLKMVIISIFTSVEYFNLNSSWWFCSRDNLELCRRLTILLKKIGQYFDNSIDNLFAIGNKDKE